LIQFNGAQMEATRMTDS